MLINMYFNKLNYNDLIMVQCGAQDCEPGHPFGPAVRNHYLIHFIRKGKGIFEVGGHTYELHEGQGFLICPDIVTFYKADETDPWHYSWVGFHGLKAESCLRYAGLDAQNPIFTCNQEEFVKGCFEQMIRTAELNRGKEIRLLGLLYMFLSELIEQAGEQFRNDDKSNQEQYVKKVIEFIEMNYMREMSIWEISQYLGLDRSYLCSVFKAVFRISPQAYLINYRMDQACEFMKNKALTIGDIARSVGYPDPLQFSKMFRKVKGACPREYRRQWTVDN